MRDLRERADRFEDPGDVGKTGAPILDLDGAAPRPRHLHPAERPELLRTPAVQQEDQQRVRVFADSADQLAALVDRLLHTLERASARLILQHVGAGLDRLTYLLGELRVTLLQFVEPPDVTGRRSMIRGAAFREALLEREQIHRPLLPAERPTSKVRASHRLHLRR